MIFRDVSLPDDMQSNFVEIGTQVVSVRVPEGWLEIEFNVRVLVKLIINAQDRGSEVWSGPMIPESGVKNLDLFPVDGLATGLVKTLMHPHQMKHPFRKILSGTLIELVRHHCGCTPLVVEICGNGHSVVEMNAVSTKWYWSFDVKINNQLNLFVNKGIKSRKLR